MDGFGAKGWMKAKAVEPSDIVIIIIIVVVVVVWNG